MQGAPLDYFPLDLEPREKQVKILEFIGRALERGFRDIVISAPTGCGKTAINMAMCFWAAAHSADGHDPGGYYLVTQKILQDQIERDFRRMKPQFNGQSSSLKSASEYPCPHYDNCKIGTISKCRQFKQKTCSYAMKRAEYLRARLSVTNYPYFLTERSYSNKQPRRTVLVCDEAHTLESQLLRFVEFSVTNKSLENWAPHLTPPIFENLYEFVAWLGRVYIPALKSRLEMVKSNLEANPGSKHWQREYTAHENQIHKAIRATDELAKDPDKWVFWQEPNRDTILKPLDAAPYLPIVRDQAHVRIYSSAYIGPSDIFCKSLGLDMDQVAHGKFGSTFPVQNRPIHMNLIGSMGMSSIQETLPKLLEECELILAKHKNEKGLVHAHSYRLATLINDYLLQTEHASRIIFPKSSGERGALLKEHIASAAPTVLISPSMAEGFSFDDDQARFQLITKVPFPFLGDKQVRAMMERSPAWYALETCKTFVQICGRAVRSETDHAHTYVLDSDFLKLYEKHPEFFPAWLTQAFQW